MDIILLLIGIIFLYLKRYDWVIAIIVILATSYLNLPLNPDYRTSSFLFSHNISDTGILLFFLLFIERVVNSKLNIEGSIQKYVLIFILFIILNGLFDYLFYNTAFSDILRYIRQWTFLLFVFIYETFRKKDVINSFKIIYYITLFISIPIIFQVVSEVEIFGDILKDSESRGIKAPSYSIFCAVLAIVNIWNLSRLSRYVHSVIFILPIMLNLKMTYAISVLLIYLLYLLFDSKFSYFRKVIAIMILVFFTSVFLITSDKFTERFLKMTTEVSSFQKKEVEGNFSYRLMHAYERFVYISKDHFYFIRGIGYVSELNFNKNVFVFGQPDYRTGKKAQLDTADIAWSLFFVRFGFLGLFLYLLLYIKIIEQYYKNRKRNKFNLSFFCMLTVFLIFTSIGNTIIAISDFFIFPILFLNQKTLSAGSLKSYILVIKKKNENNTSGF